MGMGISTGMGMGMGTGMGMNKVELGRFFSQFSLAMYGFMKHNFYFSFFPKKNPMICISFPIFLI